MCIELAGALLIVIAQMVLSNVERASQSMNYSVHKLLHEVVDAPCSYDAGYEGKEIFLACSLTDMPTFLFDGIDRKYIGFEAAAREEMYQYQENTDICWPNGKCHYSYKLLWSGEKIPSELFHTVGYKNPVQFPHVQVSPSDYPPYTVSVGDYKLTLGKEMFPPTQQIDLAKLTDEDKFTQCGEKPCGKLTADNTVVADNTVRTYKDAPEVGDVRVSFWGSSAEYVSIIARVQDKALVPSSIFLKGHEEDAHTLMSLQFLSREQLIKLAAAPIVLSTGAVWGFRFACFFVNSIGSILLIKDVIAGIANGLFWSLFEIFWVWLCFHNPWSGLSVLVPMVFIAGAFRIYKGAVGCTTPSAANGVSVELMA